MVSILNVGWIFGEGRYDVMAGPWKQLAWQGGLIVSTWWGWAAFPRGPSPARVPLEWPQEILLQEIWRGEAKQWSFCSSHVLPLIFWVTSLAPSRCLLLLFLPPQNSPVREQPQLPPHLHNLIPNFQAKISCILSWQLYKTTPFLSADLPPLPGKMSVLSQGLWEIGLLQKERLGAELVGTRSDWLGKCLGWFSPNPMTGITYSIWIHNKGDYLWSY